MRIFRCMILVATCFALPACTGQVLTPERCEVALSAAETVQDIAAVLIARGVQPERAQRIADAVALGQIALSAACAQAGLGTGNGTRIGLAGPPEDPG